MAKIKKALVAVLATFLSSVASVLAAGGQLDSKSIGAAVGLAVATGWAVWQARNAQDGPPSLRVKIRED